MLLAFLSRGKTQVPWTTLSIAVFVLIGQVWLVRTADLSAAGTLLVVTSAIATPFVLALLVAAAPRASRRIAHAAFVAAAWLWIAGILLLHLVAIAGIQLWGMIPTVSIVSSYLQNPDSLRDLWSQGVFYVAAAVATFFWSRSSLRNDC